MTDSLTLMSVHAHPDDEASKGAGTVARYHAEGVHTVLVTATGGEEGDILNPALDLPEVRADLGAVRRRELDAAAAAIGYDEVVLLGYRDSGMPDSPANSDPRSFAQAPLDEAVGRLVAEIRRVRPQVIITYPDEQSRYPHPDHLRVHEISALAFDYAADPARYPDAGEPFQPLKLYYSVWHAEAVRTRHAKFLELGLESPYVRFMERMEQDEDRPVFVEVAPSALIDVTGFYDVWRLGLLAHATQIDPTSPFWFGLPEEIDRTIWTVDAYLLARSLVGPISEEDDLFVGVRERVSAAEK